MRKEKGSGLEIKKHVSFNRDSTAARDDTEQSDEILSPKNPKKNKNKKKKDLQS